MLMMMLVMNQQRPAGLSLYQGRQPLIEITPFNRHQPTKTHRIAVRNRPAIAGGHMRGNGYEIKV